MKIDLDINVDTLIKDMPFEARMKNALIRNNILTLEQLLCLSENDVLNFRNIGPDTLRRTLKVLEKLGYSLMPNNKIEEVNNVMNKNEEIRSRISKKHSIYLKYKELLEEQRMLLGIENDLDIMLDEVKKEVSENREKIRVRMGK